MRMQKITDTFELPKDIMLGIPIVTAYGFNQITIENHKGMLAFSDHVISVRVKDCIIHVSGSCLEIKEFSKSIIIITGNLVKVDYDY